MKSSDFESDVVDATVRLMPRAFRTKDLGDRQEMQQAHSLFYRDRANGTRGSRAPGWNYYSAAGTYLSRNREELRLRPEGGRDHPDGQLWIRLDI
jgi:hypothetical protein